MIKFTKVQGIDTRYYEAGEGETILFLHGWAAPIDVYMSVLKHLEERYRVIAVETPGCGQTGEPPMGWNVSKYVDFVLDFCKEIGIDGEIVMSLSLRVRIMTKLMSEKKNEFSCKKAVIMDGAGIVPKRGMDYYARVYSYKLAKKVVSTKVGGFFFGPLWEERRGKMGSADYASSSDIMKHTLSLVVNEDLRHLYKDIDAEVLLIWGEKDDATPIEDAKIMEKNMKNAALAEIKGASHYPFLDNPRTFFAILDKFL